MDPEREDIARWLDEGRELLGMLHEQVEHLAQDNERCAPSSVAWMSSRRSLRA